MKLLGVKIENFRLLKDFKMKFASESKKNLTVEEASYKLKIKNVFENYNFDTKTSQLLINSNVLELIQNSFNKIITSACSENSRTHKRTLRKFLFEHQRLNESWNLIESN